MRLRFAAPTAITLATAIVFSAGCSKGTSNSTNSGANAGGTTTTTTTTASPSATVTQSTPTTTTPTTSADAATPRGAFTAYYEAVKRKDVDAVMDRFSKGTMTMMEAEAKRKDTTLAAVMKEGLEQAGKDIPDAVPETRNEKIDGDKATLEINDVKKGKWETLNFVREDGEWKLAFDER